MPAVGVATVEILLPDVLAQRKEGVARRHTQITDWTLFFFAVSFSRVFLNTLFFLCSFRVEDQDLHNGLVAAEPASNQR